MCMIGYEYPHDCIFACTFIRVPTITYVHVYVYAYLYMNPYLYICAYETV